MCILFVYAGEQPSEHSYKLILAVNRDEMYARPTLTAGFWDTTPNVLGGRDMEPGREGGTWLAMSKTGGIGALLNVLQTKEALSKAGNKKGRGFLVNDLLKSNDSLTYLEGVYNTSGEYNPFSMVAVDFLGVPRILYYSCSVSQKPQQLPAGIAHGVGNSYIETPFRKVKMGQKAFEQVVRESNDVSRRDELIHGILEVMKSQEMYYPDAQIEKQAHDQTEAFLRGMSSRFIKLPGYGTRTHTIILIDWDNRVFYQERTLQEPIDEHSPKWQTSTFEFNIESQR